MKAKVVVSDYLESIMDPENYDKTVRQAVRVLRRFRQDKPFDAIAFRGNSGAVAFHVAHALGLGVICVRKGARSFSNEPGTHHSVHQVEGLRSADSYVILDDFVSSGGTVRDIYHAVSTFAPHAELVGLYTYKYPQTQQSYEAATFGYKEVNRVPGWEKLAYMGPCTVADAFVRSSEVFNYVGVCDTDDGYSLDPARVPVARPTTWCAYGHKLRRFRRAP
jgi:adenine/guanine phosphoribosyltransferase-like PRPP-binding protein